MENYELLTLREVVKENGPAVVQNFEKKFKEIQVEQKRKSLKESTALYTETPPPTYTTEAEQEHIEAVYMGTESKAPIPGPKTKINPTLEEKGPNPSQDTTPIQGMIPVPDLEYTD